MSRRALDCTLGLVAWALLLAPTLATGATLPPPPATKTDPVVETLNGVQITDPYRWLEDKDAPATRSWIDGQMAYTQTILSNAPNRDRIHARLEQFLKVDAIQAPIERGGKYFFMKRRADQDLFVLTMRKGPKGADEALVDPHPLSEDHSTTVSLLDVSQDGSLVAYGIRNGGQDEVEIHFIDTATRQELPDRLPKARYFTVSIEPDRKGVFYGKYASIGSRIFHHAMGGAAGDTMVFGDGYTPEKITVSSLSEDGRYLLISVFYGSAGTRSELWVMNVAAGTPPTPIVNDLEANFTGDIAGDRLYLKTDWQAPNGRILLVDLKNPARDRWKEIVPAGKGVIEDVTLAGGLLYVNTLENVSSSVRIYDPEGKSRGSIAFPTLGTVGDVRGQWSSNEAFFSFSSYHVPSTIYHVDVKSGERSEWWRADVPIDSDRFDLKQVWYPSKDGTKVPMFVLCKKGTKLDGSHPTLLTGYGGFNVTETPQWSTEAAFWVDNGGVFALPNLRGGGELGEEWHKAGMLDKKQNVFDDFAAAAQWLIQNGYTKSDRLAVSGGSNGGLLVGAMLTQHPDLTRAVLCSVPLLDMLRYHRFLVARFWVPEYGSAENPQQFPFIRAYSPYQNVKQGVKYPAVMLVSGDSDTRVDPLHARKMTALLQASTGSGTDRPIILHYDTQSGHSAGKPIRKVVDDDTDEMLFLTWQVGLPVAAPKETPRKAAVATP
jgi:prolyl oligopeptidase